MNTFSCHASQTKLVAAARDYLAMQVALPVGALRLCAVVRELGEPYASRHRVFAEFAQAMPPDAPIGTSRLHWAPAALIARDAMLADVEGCYRARLLEECIEIMHRYKWRGS